MPAKLQALLVERPGRRHVSLVVRRVREAIERATDPPGVTEHLVQAEALAAEARGPVVVALKSPRAAQVVEGQREAFLIAGLAPRLDRLHQVRFGVPVAGSVVCDHAEIVQ